MKVMCLNRRNRTAAVLRMLLLLWLLPAAAGESLGEPAGPSSAPGEVLRLGERMYREGILPSGKLMEAYVSGDVPVGGTFTCVSCHVRSGLGSKEGGVFTPPTNGRTLYRPVRAYYKGVEITAGPPRRPAYTDETLAEVIRSGVDPAGVVLSEVMPRYMLEEDDMAILIAYLKSLSAGFSPGVTDTTIRFATVISEDVGSEERDAMLGPLEDFAAYRNKSAKVYGLGSRQARMAESMLGSRDAAYLNMELSVWELKGPPGTWRSQLEEYNRREPAFALLGGITKKEWKPVHDFSEANRIPALFPVTDYPVISETDWYTLYLSKGYYQEGETAARYLGSREELVKGRAVVEVVRDSAEGHALSAGFRKTWRDLGLQETVSIALKKGEVLTAEVLGKPVVGGKPAVVLVWDGPAALPALESLQADGIRPETVVISYGYMRKGVWALKEELRDVTYITFPYRLPKDEPKDKFNIPFLRKREVRGEAELISKRMYPVITVLTQALMDLRGNYYRDNFLDVISMMSDQWVPLYERLSFGPGQRYAAKGCYVVQLSKGEAPELIRKSDWVIH